MLYIIFLEWILKIAGRIVIKPTLALTNTCSSCNSNEGKACWCDSFQLRRSQLAWLDGFQQLFRWKEANQDRLPLWLFAERPGGFSRIPFKCKGWKQTRVRVLSDRDYWRMIKTLFLIRSGGGVHPVSWSLPVHTACITSVWSPFSLLCEWLIFSRSWNCYEKQQIQLIFFFPPVVFIKDQVGQCDDSPDLIVNCLFAAGCRGAPQTLTNNSKDLFQSLRRGGDDM